MSSRFDVRKMLSLYDSGVGCVNIARAVGCSVQTVAHHIRRHRGALRVPKRIDWPIEQMRALYEEGGLTIQEIADLLGQKQKVVNKIARKHHFQMRRRGPKSGPAHKGWKGGRSIDKSGYVLIYLPDHRQANSNGYVREHRVVMEKKLGRPLLRTEVVHHRDDNRQNNDPDNLQLYETNGQHLAETLKGKCPNWTPAGRARIGKRGLRHTSQQLLEPNEQPSPQTTDRCSGSREQNFHSP